MERGVCGDQFRARRPPGASAGVARREPRPRAYRAFRVVGDDDVRAAARIPRTDSDSALPEPRKRGDRLYALPDRLFQIRRIGGRADGGAALHARTDRRDEGARLRVRGGDAACRGRDLSARQGRRCRSASDAHRAFRGAACGGGPPAGKVGADHGRRHDLGADARIAHGAGVAHTYCRNARCGAGRRPVGAVRRAGGVFRARGAGDPAEIHG